MSVNPRVMSRQLSLFQCGGNSRKRSSETSDVDEDDSDPVSKRPSSALTSTDSTSSRQIVSSTSSSASSSSSHSSSGSLAPTASDIALTPQCSPSQPTGITFPVTLYSGKARSFNPAWFTHG